MKPPYLIFQIIAIANALIDAGTKTGPAIGTLVGGLLVSRLIETLGRLKPVQDQDEDRSWTPDQQEEREWTPDTAWSGPAVQAADEGWPAEDRWTSR